ncbi:P44/Msp2 family outer membrane protein, partial [Anaplasma phagocytophilum]|uniref:P44/Msp2 family outer membrane protein n=1 Tax=Anaplasma phagocytophilum TaxID=948 RepID=UPI0012D8EF97
EADTVYLLAKELAYDVVNHQETRLATALAGYKGEDIARFAKAVGITSPEIDKKVCTKTHAKGEDNNAATYKAKPGDTDTAQCSGFNVDQPTHPFSEFAKVLEEKDEKNWPTGRYYNSGIKEHNANSNAKAVAKDLTKLTPEEKTIVAGLLAKTIEGGEVVEIRAVSSTSVMVNACYDLLSEGLGV